MSSQISRDIVATVLRELGVRGSAAAQNAAVVNVDARLEQIRTALVGSQSILSLLHYRERASLSSQSRDDVFETLREVEKAEAMVRQ